MSGTDIAYLAGLAVLLTGAVWAVWRGMAHRDASDKNKHDIGGGAGDGGVHD